MAYTITSKAATLVKKVGIVDQPRQYVGVVALSSGVATVSIPGVKRIVAAFVSPQSANATTVSATSTNTFSIAGSGSDNVMWLAYVE